MFIFSQVGKYGRDGTKQFDVILDDKYTVKTFIRAVLRNYQHEWGSIIIDSLDNYCCDYSYGKLKSKLKHTILNKTVISAKAYGGYSYMTYILTTEEKQSF